MQPAFESGCQPPWGSVGLGGSGVVQVADQGPKAQHHIVDMSGAIRDLDRLNDGAAGQDSHAHAVPAGERVAAHRGPPTLLNGSLVIDRCTAGVDALPLRGGFSPKFPLVAGS